MVVLSSVIDDMGGYNLGDCFVYTLVLDYFCLHLIERSSWSLRHILVTILQHYYSEFVDIVFFCYVFCFVLLNFIQL